MRKALRLLNPGLIVPTRFLLTFTLLRDGRVTQSLKSLWLYDNPSSLNRINLFSCSDGQTSLPQSVLASAFSGTFFGIGFDADATDPLVRGALVEVSGSGDLSYNIFSGTSEGGTAATVRVNIKVEGVSLGRPCVGVERQPDGQWRVAGSAVGTDDEMTLSVTGGVLYVMAIDDYGVAYEPNLAVIAGQTIRPSLYSGWLYRITEPGTLPATEPQWWAAEGDNASRLLGTARAIAVRYYQPLAHGPLPVELL